MRMLTEDITLERKNPNGETSWLRICEWHNEATNTTTWEVWGSHQAETDESDILNYRWEVSDAIKKFFGGLVK